MVRAQRCLASPLTLLVSFVFLVPRVVFPVMVDDASMPCCAYKRLIEAPLNLVNPLRSAPKPEAEGDLDAIVASAINAASGDSAVPRMLATPTQDAKCIDNRVSALTGWTYPITDDIWEVRKIQSEAEFTRFPYDFAIFDKQNSIQVLTVDTNPNFPADWNTAPANSVGVECQVGVQWNAADLSKTAPSQFVVLSSQQYLAKWQDWASATSYIIGLDTGNVMEDVYNALVGMGAPSLIGIPSTGCTPCTKIRTTTPAPIVTTVPVVVNGPSTVPSANSTPIAASSVAGVVTSALPSPVAEVTAPSSAASVYSKMFVLTAMLSGILIML